MPILQQRPQGWPARLVREFIAVLRKPLVGPKPYPRREFAAYIVIAIASAAYLAVAVAQSDSASLPLVLALSALIVVSGVVTISFGPSQLDTDCSDVFVAISIVGLGATGGGAQVALIACLVVALVRSPDWQRAVAVFSFFGSFAATALLVEHSVSNLGLASALDAGIAVAAMFFVWRIVEVAYHTIDVWSTPGEGERVGGLWGKVWHDHGDSIRESMTWLATFAPTAILGALAFHIHPATILLVAAPYTIAWNNTRHAARLLHAEHRMGTDELTGLTNRARLFERAEEEMQHASLYGHDLVLALGDLDDFKQINDTMGHLVGDEVLRRTAEAIGRCVDSRSCMAARYGGEEFVVLLPATDIDAASEIIERVRAAVQEDLEEFGTTISFGIARRAPADGFTALMHRADQAMYFSKLTGKNRTTTWTPAIIDVSDHAGDIDGHDAGLRAA